MTDIVGAFVGANFTHMVSARVLLLSFGGLRLIVGLRRLVAGQNAPPGRRYRPLQCLVTGVAVGLLTGFLGVGGGFFVLPALVLLAGLEMKAAFGTSLAMIAASSFADLIGQLHYVQFDWLITLGSSAQRWPVWAGGLQSPAGFPRNRYAEHLSAASLRWAFSS